MMARPASQPMNRREALARARMLWGEMGAAINILDALYRVGYIDSRGDPCWMGTSTESFEAAFEDFTNRFKVTR